MKKLAILPIFLLSVYLIQSSIGCRKTSSPEEPPLSNAALQTRTLAEGLTIPWEIIYGPDNYLWFTERPGRISRLSPQTGEKKLLYTISEVVSRGEGGLLGMALHPDLDQTPFVYVAYDYENAGNYRGKVVRFRYDGSTLTEPLTLLDNIPAASIHNGCRLMISSDQKLFITTGDAGSGDNAQRTGSLSGKILRINLDGSIPADNPIPGNPVYSHGHRNPQGLVQVGAMIYSSEHGPDVEDEINIIEKGRNYGWPNVEGYCNTEAENSFCAANNVKEPIQSWSPTIAPSGLTYYNKDIIPQWKNSLLLLTLKGSRLIQLKLNAAGTQITENKDFFANEFGRLRAICIAPDGKVYISTSNGSNDKIIEISRSN